MKILVTGANGFLGRVVCNNLFLQGYQPIACVRQVQQQAYFKERGISCYQGSWEDPLFGERVLNHVEVILHLAGGGKANRPSSFHDNNVKPTQTLLKLLKSYKTSVKRFIYVSSLAAVGPSTLHAPKKNDSELHFPKAPVDCTIV